MQPTASAAARRAVGAAVAPLKLVPAAMAAGTARSACDDAVASAGAADASAEAADASAADAAEAAEPFQ